MPLSHFKGLVRHHIPRHPDQEQQQQQRRRLP